MLVAIEYDAIEPDLLGLDPKATPLDLLLAVARNPSLPLHTRIRAAGMAAPFVHPRLQATAIIGMGLDFSVRLERAVKRSDSVRLLPRQLEPITAQPEPFRRRV